MKTFKLALDWTPNVNHIGFFVARDKGFYKSHKIKVEIISPDEDNYATTPAKKVEQGIADFALCPTESLISYQTKSKPFPLVGVSSIFQEDLSAICVLKSSEIKSPKDLDGKVYASYKARYEDGIVRQMIKNDGGEADLKITYPDKLGIWNRLVKGNAHATWIFLNWEALQAEAEGIELTNFKLVDYNIPYSYSPVIAGDREDLKQNTKNVEAFLEATKEGYYYAQAHPKESAEILNQFIPEHDKNIDLVKAIHLSCKVLGDEHSWGKMNIDKVEVFLEWLRTHCLENSNITARSLVLLGD
jgi:ABC-type nitrate/sulfonate/bicarbonate transport system substrate-binding protein